MLDRRQLLAAVAATAAQPLLGAAPGAPKDRFLALIDGFMDANLQRSPTLATELGVDTGALAPLRSRLPDRSLAQVARDRTETARRLRAMDGVDPSGLPARERIQYQSLRFGYEAQAEADREFEYGGGSTFTPYVVSQLGGSYQSVPDFLDSQHPVETREDAEAYLARLRAFAVGLDQETEQVRHDAGLGVTPPDFALRGAVRQLAGLRDAPAAEAVLVQSLARRTREKAIAGDWEQRATAIYVGEVQPALARQAGVLEGLAGRAGHDAGVWRLPHGDAYYAMALRGQTTTSLSPEEIQRLGRQYVGEYSARIDEIMRGQGLTRGSVGERLRGMFTDPRFLVPNTDEAKEALIGRLNVKIRGIEARLPQWFGVLPRSSLVIRRVPKYVEAGTSGGYYNNPSLDGSRPGAYYVNLRDTAEVPSWTLPTLTYHEGVPGHHLQTAIQQEAKVPLLVKVTNYTAYNEGWALYAEQLAVEMGMYRDDPFGEIGMLHDALLRAVRLVVDSGLHHLRWSREEAIRVYIDALGDPEATAVSAIERYSVWPGQACSYLCGKIRILQMRERASKALGARFDIRGFHDAILTCGSVPLDVLDDVVDDYVAAT